MRQNVLSLEILFCLVAVPLMLLSAVIAETRRTQDSLRKVSGSLVEAQEQERHRIAPELHDDLGQRLALAKIKLDELIEESDDPLKLELTNLSDEVSTISERAREISHGLYPSRLEYLGLAAAVRKLCDEMLGKYFSISLAMGNLPHQLQPSVSLALYRITQETLHNIVTHSKAKKVQVELGADDRQILLRITDDGIGFDCNYEASGLGLSNMQQRVQWLGGTIDIKSYPQAGTRIEVRVPLNQSSAPEKRLDSPAA